MIFFSEIRLYMYCIFHVQLMTKFSLLILRGSYPLLMTFSVSLTHWSADAYTKPRAGRVNKDMGSFTSGSLYPYTELSSPSEIYLETMRLYLAFDILLQHAPSPKWLFSTVHSCGCHMTSSDGKTQDITTSQICFTEPRNRILAKG